MERLRQAGPGVGPLGIGHFQGQLDSNEFRGDRDYPRRDLQFGDSGKKRHYRFDSVRRVSHNSRNFSSRNPVVPNPFQTHSSLLQFCNRVFLQQFRTSPVVSSSASVEPTGGVAVVTEEMVVPVFGPPETTLDDLAPLQQPVGEPGNAHGSRQGNLEQTPKESRNILRHVVRVARQR